MESYNPNNKYHSEVMKEGKAQMAKNHEKIGRNAIAVALGGVVIGASAALADSTDMEGNALKKLQIQLYGWIDQRNRLLGSLGLVF